MMPLALLRQYEQVYLAAPCTPNKERAAAAQESARVAGELLLEEIYTYPAAVLGHAIYEACDALDPNDPEMWERMNSRQMDNSDAMVIVEMPGWELAPGLAQEIDYCRKAGKPVHWLNPLTMELR